MTDRSESTDPAPRPCVATINHHGFPLEQACPEIRFVHKHIVSRCWVYPRAPEACLIHDYLPAPIEEHHHGAIVCESPLCPIGPSEPAPAVPSAPTCDNRCTERKETGRSHGPVCAAIGCGACQWDSRHDPLRPGGHMFVWPAPQPAPVAQERATEDRWATCSSCGGVDLRVLNVTGPRQGDVEAFQKIGCMDCGQDNGIACTVGGRYILFHRPIETPQPAPPVPTPKGADAPGCDCHLRENQVCDVCQGVSGKDAPIATDGARLCVRCDKPAFFHPNCPSHVMGHEWVTGHAFDPPAPVLATEPEELLPCPFCGGGAACFRVDPDQEKWHKVACQSCGADHGTCATREQAVAAWNRRTATAQPEPIAESCEHCSADLLPRRKEPVLCESCVSICSDNCDHRWQPEPPAATTEHRCSNGDCTYENCESRRQWLERLSESATLGPDDFGGEDYPAPAATKPEPDIRNLASRLAEAADAIDNPNNAHRMFREAMHEIAEGRPYGHREYMQGNHVHPCPKCYQRVECPMTCSVEGDGERWVGGFAECKFCAHRPGQFVAPSPVPEPEHRVVDGACTEVGCGFNLSHAPAPSSHPADVRGLAEEIAGAASETDADYANCLPRIAAILARHSPLPPEPYSRPGVVAKLLADAADALAERDAQLSDLRAQLDIAAKEIVERDATFEALSRQHHKDGVEFRRQAAQLATVTAERDGYKKIVADTVDGMECIPGCDSEAHEELCPVVNPAAAWRTLREEVAEKDWRISFMLTQWEDFRRIAFASVRGIAWADTCARLTDALNHFGQTDAQAEQLATLRTAAEALLRRLADMEGWYGFEEPKQAADLRTALAKIGGAK